MDVDTVHVWLTADEHAHATAVGEARDDYDTQRGWRPRARQRPGDTHGAHVLGALGECAAAIGLGLHWPARTTRPDHGTPDVERWEVRTASVWARHGSLIVRPPVDPDDCYLAVVQHDQYHYELRGWCCGADVTSRYTLTDRGNGRNACYWIPWDDLRTFAWYPGEPDQPPVSAPRLRAALQRARVGHRQ